MASVKFSLPSSSLFQFPPRNDPTTLPPPIPGTTLSAPPIAIPASWYNAALDAKVPITIACVYAVTVQVINKYNRSRGNKAWPISKTRGFFAFVVAHNIFLAVYSAWTFVGMYICLKRSLESWSGEFGLASTVDSLCKVHGARGLGNAVAYDPTTSTWVSQSPNVLLAANGTPDQTDLGRIWNEGLAFYGWWFYLSKFYEVLDTLIILAKGKRSSTLQTYHHAGAMMCMWAGIRYMSPPIWMFVFVNSGIHALMYTYYTLTAFNIPISQSLKRSLTSLQITQFLVGSAYAALHSFISYTIPVQVPTSIAGAATTAVSSAGLEGLGSMIKKILFRAVGEEGLAENVANGPSTLPTKGTNHSNGRPTTYRTEYQTIPCIDTSGQTFAIWFNVLYLAPLTVLFVRFFIKSYSRRYKAAQKAKVLAAEMAGNDALKGVERELNERPNEMASGKAYANGHANGKANGKANGNAHGNGYVNGKANGKSNGHANGGAYASNGKANGKH